MRIFVMGAAGLVGGNVEQAAAEKYQTQVIATIRRTWKPSNLQCQPVMRPKDTIRDKRGVHRRHGIPKSRSQRVMESDHIREGRENELRALYISLEPAELVRVIDRKLNKLYRVYQEKNNPQRVERYKQQKRSTATFHVAQREGA